MHWTRSGRAYAGESEQDLFSSRLDQIIDTLATADRAELVAGSRAPDKRAREGKGVATTAHIALILWSLLVILPLVWTVLSSFKSTQEVLGNPLSLPGKLRFSIRVAQRLMQVATNAAISNATNSSLLPPSLDDYKPTSDGQPQA